MEDDKGAVKSSLLQAENRRLKDAADEAQAQAQACKMLNQQMLERYTTDLGQAIREKQHAQDQVAELETWNQILSTKVDEQQASARLHQREAASLKQEMVAKDQHIKKLQKDIETISKEKAGLDRNILNLNYQLEVQTDDFHKQTAALKEAHEREMSELEGCLRTEIEKHSASETKAQYERELRRMWLEAEDLRALAETLRQTQRSLKQAEEEVERARDTPVSSAVVPRPGAGSSWKAQLHVGSVVFDLGIWDGNAGRERAEKGMSKLIYKLTGKVSEDCPLTEKEMAKVADTPLVEVFCQLKRRERLSKYNSPAQRS